MPCRYYTPEEEADMAADNARRQERAAQERIQVLSKKETELDSLTKNLCSMLKRLEKDFTEESFKDVTTPAIRKWWKEHKEMDAAREAAEANTKIVITKRPARPYHS